MAGFNDLVGIPWKLHGRDQEGVDCLGAVLLALKVRGVEAFDPWAHIRERYRDGQRVFAGEMPSFGWRRVCDGSVQDDDLLMGPGLDDEHTRHIYLVCEGARRALHCSRATGVMLAPIEAVHFDSVWRHRER